jgi:hypothetical protein
MSEDLLCYDPTWRSKFCLSVICLLLRHGTYPYGLYLAFTTRGRSQIVYGSTWLPNSNRGCKPPVQLRRSVLGRLNGMVSSGFMHLNLSTYI